jgi:hypothetical protein
VLLRLIREQVGAEPELHHPAMNLERFFLDVIEQAHADSTTPAATGHARSSDNAPR